jgi:GNAT superfamily N-acetyltransferase
VGEVKRVFVEKDARRQGVARRIMERLETIAAQFGYRALRLETGILQPEAINLYKSAGYRRVRCYGRYVDNPLSVCFEKRLG